MKKTKSGLEKYAKRSYAGLVVRAFFYSIIPSFFMYMSQLNSGIHPQDAFARAFCGTTLIILGILIIQKKLAIRKLEKSK